VHQRNQRYYRVWVYVGMDTIKSMSVSI